MTTPPPAIHYLPVFRPANDPCATYRAVCGAERVDPAHELATADRAAVTCRGCLRRMARQAAASPDGARVGGGGRG